MSSLDKQINQLKQIIADSQNIVFFGGAGVSTESGIPDFRSAQGIFTSSGQKIRPETIVSHSFFIEQPEQFYKFYREKLLYPKAKPNPAHLAIAKLEAEGKMKAVITQNIDGLHQAAGSESVMELHGSVHRNYCTRCGKFFDLDYILTTTTIIPHCVACDGVIKPDVVLYEEALDDSVVSAAINALQQADVLIVAGTSLVVYPAAGLVNYFNGSELILINLSATEIDNRASLMINAPVGSVMNQLICKNYGD